MGKNNFPLTLYPCFLLSIKKDPEIISRVNIRFSGINKLKITQPQEILLLPKVELMEIFWIEVKKF